MTIDEAIIALKQGKKVLYKPSRYAESFPYESYHLVYFVKEQVLYNCLIGRYKCGEYKSLGNNIIPEFSGNIFSDDWEVYEGKVE